jgi:5'-nucleotidase
LILVSNDDGIHSDGIQRMAEALADLGEVVVVAPDREKSAASHSLTMHRPLRIQQMGPRRFAVDGTPTDCILLGIRRVLEGRTPQLVVSGINQGANLGDDIAYSGTVSAAMEGARRGIPSLAVSLAAREAFRFEAAADFARKLAAKLLRNPPSGPTLLNINVPNIPGERIRGVRVTRQGKRIYNGAVVEKTDPRGRKYYWIGGREPGFIEMEDSDIEAVDQGWISVTPLKLDLTDFEAMQRWRAWGILEEESRE